MVSGTLRRSCSRWRNLPGCLFRFPEQADLDHVENNFAEVFAAFDAPFLEDHRGHRAELRECVFADAIEQFLAADVAHLFAILPEDQFLGVVERVFDEVVSIPLITGVLGEDQVQRGVKGQFLHITERRQSRGGRRDAQRDRF